MHAVHQQSPNSTEEALRRAAFAVSVATGERVFSELVRALATTLEVEIAFIALPKDGDPGMLRMLAYHADGQVVEDFEYGLFGTPCETVVGQGYRIYPERLQELFPFDEEFARLGVQSYAGCPLFDTRGEPTGLMAVVSRAPMIRPQLIESVLQIFAARAMAELERRRAEAERRELEASYRAIFEASEDGIYVHDWESGAIVDVNPRVSEMTGYTRDELLRMDASRLGAYGLSESAAIMAEAIGRARAGEAVRLEFHRRNKDGSASWDEVRLKAAMINGRRRILAFTREITERKLAEEALRASEEQYRAIFDVTTDGLVLRDAQLRLVDVNPALLAMTGFTREEALGEESVMFAPPEVQERVMGAYRRALAGEPVSIEHEAIRKDGSRFAVEVRFLPIQYRGRPHALAIARDITEHKRAEEAMRASEEQYKAIFNASADPLLLWNSRLQRVDVNPAYERVYGWTREEVIGRGYEDRGGLSPEYAERRRELVRRSLAGETCHVELESMRKSGERFLAEIRTIPFRHRGEPHVLAVARDITERKAAEEALRASEEQYRAIFNASFDAMAIRSLDGEIVDVNPALESMYGYTRDELIGKTFGPIIPEEFAGPYRAYLAKIAAGGHVRTESDLPRKDGSSVHIEVLGSPVMYRGKRHVLSVARDITERKAAEQALRASEEQYRAIFNASDVGLAVLDPPGCIVDANPAFGAMFGYGREELLSVSPKTLVPRESLALCNAVLAAASEGRVTHGECRALRRDGATFDVELRGMPMHYRGLPHKLVVVRDITARKRAEDERRQLEAQLRQAQKMEAIGQLAGGIAHDFNNILTGIMGYLALAIERQAGIGDARIGRYLDQAHAAAQRARELIQQMLTFSRGHRGQPRALALAPLIEESVQLLGSSLPSSVELRTELDPDLPAVMIDPVQLEQVLLNLCINARDAMNGAGAIRIGVRSRGPRERVCASCRKPAVGPFVELNVRDTGPGIAPEVLERMFEPFFSTKEVGRGSGMGLSTVHGIVHECGGHILVETSPRGSTFRVLFPALGAERAPAQREGPLAEPGRVRGPLDGRVLVVDDERMVGEFMAELLEGWGLRAVVLHDPLEAERWLAADPLRVDAVVTDQTMPKLTGVQLAARLKALRPGLPVILYTGYAESIAARELERHGVRALLRKPIEPEALFEQLRAALGC